MKVINIHSRILHQPKENISPLLQTLATANDKILATDKWPAMKLDNGLKVGSQGGHGPIKYSIQKYCPGDLVQFGFTKPNGFNGIHKFEIIELKQNETEIRHTIEMNTAGTGTLSWAIAIRWLHDAYIEDAFDKVDNYFLTKKKTTEWSIWVRILRTILMP